jgi:cobyrinic acid a,c-diamide synthase
MRRLFVSAIHKSSGKTMVSVGLAAAFAARGLAVRTFKKGPDYIDPMWLAQAGNCTCYNLDFNTQSDDEIRATFARGGCGADVALIEGNKGLHDGLDTGGRDSSAALAKLLRAAVVLVVDTCGMTRGIAPLIIGYAEFDPNVEILGVILNKVGTARQETKLRQALEYYTDTPVLGVVGRDETLNVDERHLGLTTPTETQGPGEIIARARDVVMQSIDLDRLIRQADTDSDGCSPPFCDVTTSDDDLRVAVPRDAAFGFYYADDFEAFAQAGAKLVFFDTLRDEKLPEADALFIGGGFPETQAAALADNTSLRGQIRDALAAGLPTYAECGGLMYLARSITWKGQSHEMVGAVPADCVMRSRPQGRGLVLLEETQDLPWPDRAGAAPIPAHEFHYAGLENIDSTCRFAYRVRRGFGIDGHHDGLVVNNVVAGFSHLRDTSRHHWVARFVAFARRLRATRRSSGYGDGVGRTPSASLGVAAE